MYRRLYRTDRQSLNPSNRICLYRCFEFKEKVHSHNSTTVAKSWLGLKVHVLILNTRKHYGVLSFLLESLTRTPNPWRQFQRSLKTVTYGYNSDVYPYIQSLIIKSFVGHSVRTINLVYIYINIKFEKRVGGRRSFSLDLRYIKRMSIKF